MLQLVLLDPVLHILHASTIINEHTPEIGSGPG
jgi:hypothetical protein